jgi:hypothetical protein
MAVEKAYFDAIVGIRPASLGLNELSGRTFREIVEYFALLFSSRPSGQSRHIPARYFVDLGIVFRYFYTPAIAEAQLEFFSWKWRYAVMYCVATAILGLPEPPGATPSPQKSEYSESFPFRDLLHSCVSPGQRLEILEASRAWPEPMQLRFWLAVKLLEGRTWDSPNSLRFKCQSQSPG